MPFFQDIKKELQFGTWKEVHRLPRFAVLQYQKIMLNRILTHAYKFPLFQNLWDSFPARHKLSSLPLTNKQTYKKLPLDHYINPSTFQNKIRWQYTSGSTGEPFQFVPASLPFRYYDFSAMRFLWWRSVSTDYIFDQLRIAKIRMASFSRENRLFIPVSYFFNNPSDALSSLISFRPEVVMTYPTILVEIGKSLVGEYRKKLVFDFAVCYGEMLNSSMRKFISETFGCEVYNVYGLEEFGAVGVECSNHQGFHLNSESFVLEIIDEKGIPVPAGYSGKIVVTSLLNYNMPFIRYETGDIGRVIKDTCQCGISTPSFFVEGREGFFLKSLKRKVHHFEIAGILEKFSESIRQYQIRKRDTNFFKVLIVSSTPSNNFHALNLKLKDIFLDETTFELEVVDRIERLPGGKTKIFVDETKENFQ